MYVPMEVQGNILFGAWQLKDRPLDLCRTPQTPKENFQLPFRCPLPHPLPTQPEI